MKGMYVLFCCLLAGAGFLGAGCSDTLTTQTDGSGADGTEALSAQHYPAPAGLVQVLLDTQNFEIWPYTGSGFDGTTVDPINLIFVGEADPVQIRATLLALDGDRTAFGMPDAFPFNATWDECIGGMQTTFAEGSEWSASVIQLQAGTYELGRTHVRLFPGGELPDGRRVTLGAAHFEVLIPGTAEHQVLSWEVAQQVVLVDMIRSGMLAAPPASSGIITQVPSYRDIPDFIYNQLPIELKALIGGPLGPVTEPVPLANDGEASMLYLGGAAPILSGEMNQALTIQFDQVIPKPFCADGPYDWVHASGAVRFERSGRVNAAGRYTFNSKYEGTLVIVPLDITTNPPTPIGAPFEADILETQNGYIQGLVGRGSLHESRVAPQEDGLERLDTHMVVSSNGRHIYRHRVRCLDGS